MQSYRTLPWCGIRGARADRRLMTEPTTVDCTRLLRGETGRCPLDDPTRGCPQGSQLVAAGVSRQPVYHRNASGSSAKNVELSPFNTAKIGPCLAENWNPHHVHSSDRDVDAASFWSITTRTWSRQLPLEWPLRPCDIVIWSSGLGGSKYHRFAAF